jgi:hypothetical protein
MKDYQELDQNDLSDLITKMRLLTTGLFGMLQCAGLETPDPISRGLSLMYQHDMVLDLIMRIEFDEPVAASFHQLHALYSERADDAKDRLRRLYFKVSDFHTELCKFEEMQEKLENML